MCTQNRSVSVVSSQNYCTNIQTSVILCYEEANKFQPELRRRLLPAYRPAKRPALISLRFRTPDMPFLYLVSPLPILSLPLPYLPLLKDETQVEFESAVLFFNKPICVYC